MVIRTCECCNYSTSAKHVFEDHLKSKKHLLQQNLSITPVKSYDCCKCNKKYFSYSGLYVHNKKCKANSSTNNSPTVTNDQSNAVITAEMFQKLVESNEKLHNEIQEIKRNQEKTAENPACINITNNITNNNNYNDIRIYLNSKCDNAMNIDKFIEFMELNRDDIIEMNKSKTYCLGAIKLIKKYIQSISLENRPMHCVNKIPSQPAMFFIRDENIWKEECHSMINYQLGYVDYFENDSEKMLMTHFLDKFIEKLEELCSSDKNLKHPDDIVNKSYKTDKQINILYEMKHMLELDVSEI